MSSLKDEKSNLDSNFYSTGRFQNLKPLHRTRFRAVTRRARQGRLSLGAFERLGQQQALEEVGGEATEGRGGIRLKVQEEL